MSFYLFLPHEKAKFCPHLKYGMDANLFLQKTQHLLKYSPKAERSYLITQTRACEYCWQEVKNQRIESAIYRLGTPNEHIRHVCKPCGNIVFDGSKVKEQTRRPLEPKPIRVRNKTGRGRTRVVHSPEGEFTSLNAAAAHFKKSPSTILSWMKARPKEFYYLS